MKVKDFFSSYDVEPISKNPLHGPVTDKMISFLTERNEERRQQAIQSLGSKWLVHPANQVQRKEAV